MNKYVELVKEVLQEKFVTSKKMRSDFSVGQVYVEIFENPTPSELKSVVEDQDRLTKAIKLLWDNKKKKLYLFSEPQQEHLSIADELNIDIPDMVHINVSYARKIIEAYVVFEYEYSDENRKQLFQGYRKYAESKVKRLFPGFKSEVYEK